MRNGHQVTRDVVTALLIGLPLLVLTLFAWATRHPEHPWVEEARSWPLVGTWTDSAVPRTAQERAGKSTDPPSIQTVTQYTDLHLWFDRGSEIFANVADATPSEVLTVPTRLEIRERRGDWLEVAGHSRGWVQFSGDPIVAGEPPSQHRTVWVRPGDALLDRAGGRRVERVGAIANLPVVATATNDWVEVIYDDRKLWLRAPEFTGGEPPLGSAVAPLLPMAAVPIDTARRDSALRAFSGEPITSTAGPYTMVGDSPRIRSLTALCHRRLAAADREFEALTGLTPQGPGRETLLVFARRDNYLAFLTGAPRVSDQTGLTDPDGYSLPAEGFAATFFEGRSDHEVCAVLVHEVAHLVSRRALGPALPPWLAEGLATHIEDGNKAGADVTLGPTLVRMEDEFYAGDLDQRYRIVAAAVGTLLTDPRFAEASRSFLAERAAGQALPSGPGTTAAGYWSGLVDQLGIGEEELWRHIASTS